MLFALYKNRFNLSNTTIKKTYAYLFAGYRAKYSYWEVIVLLRTVSVVVVGSSVTSPVARIGAVLLVVQFGLLVTHTRHPPRIDGLRLWAFASRVDSRSPSPCAR